MDDLATYILDLVQNSITAKSSIIKVSIIEDNLFHLIIDDNGVGMDEMTLQKASSPFFSTRKTRKIGLGLPMIRMLSEQTQGTFNLSSYKNKGTKLDVSFDHTHIDMPPLGDFGDMVVMISIHQDVEELIFTYQKNKNIFTYQLSEIKKMLGITLDDINVINYLKEYINQEINKVRGKL